MSSNDPSLATESIEEEMENIQLGRVDEAAAVPAPTNVGPLWVQQETDHRANEQVPQWRADGVVEARSAESTIGALDTQVTDLEARIAQHREIVETTKSDMEATIRGLAHHVRRRHDAAKLHYFRMLLIFLGDVVGVAASLINFGLLVSMAIIQGLSLGGAVMALGLAGAEGKDLQRRRDLQRPVDELTDDEQRFTQLFAGPRYGEAYAKIGIAVAAAALLLIFGGVFAVQAATDGLAAGLFFGCLGAAIGLASAINYWSYSDYVADVVDNAKAAFAKADVQLHAMTDNAARKEHGRASAELASIKEEHELRGQAAQTHLLALGKKVLRNNPAVAGHGSASKAAQLGREPATQTNGQTPPQKAGL